MSQEERIAVATCVVEHTAGAAPFSPPRKPDYTTEQQAARHEQGGGGVGHGEEAGRRGER